MLLKTRTGIPTLLAVVCLPVAAQMQWRELEGGRIEVLDQGKPALVYNFGVQASPRAPADRARCCYIFPLWTPAGVSPLDDFPTDHFHHHGIFWAWPVVESGGIAHDLWMYGNIQHRFERWLRREAATTGVTLEVENGWYAGSEKWVSETVRICVHPAAASSRVVKIALRLAAVRNSVTLRGSRDPGKSYGGLSARFAPREATVIRTSDGFIHRDEDLRSHGWAELEGRYGGKHAVLCIVPDEHNPGAPHQWCLRHYGFLGVSFPGKTQAADGFTVEPGAPIDLRFTIVASDGTAEN